MLLRNGRIYSPVGDTATAMLVVGDRVAWVGSSEAAAVHVDTADRVVDLAGALVTPAFVDAHVHTTETGLALDGVDLTGCRSLVECLDRISARAATRPGAPIFGHGWDEQDWVERRPPARTEVDRASGGAVAYLTRVDVHSAVVSSALLDRAKEITELPGYEASGLVRRDAHHLARRVSRDQISPGWRRELQRMTLRRAASLGIGCLHEIAAPHIAGRDDLSALLALAADEPNPEVIAYWGELGTVDEVVALGVRGIAGDLCIDGSVGSHTAWLHEPYADAPEERGFDYIDQDSAAEHVIAATRANVQAGFHVIGDAAVGIAVEAICRAAEVCGPEQVIAARHRLEHVEMVAADDIPRLARLGVVASVQPRFDALWGGEQGMYAARLGIRRVAGMNPFAALQRAGVTMAFGSDSPVTPLAPWDSVRAAARHHNPRHAIAVEAAFAAHTEGGWRAARVDDAGVLLAGRPATYAVWESTDQSPPQNGSPGSRLPDLGEGDPNPHCLLTVVRGRTIYAAGS